MIKEAQGSAGPEPGFGESAARRASNDKKDMPELFYFAAPYKNGTKLQQNKKHYIYTYMYTYCIDSSSRRQDNGDTYCKHSNLFMIQSASKYI